MNSCIPWFQVGRAYAVLCSNQRLRVVPDLSPLTSLNMTLMVKLDYCDLANVMRRDFPPGLQLAVLHLNGNSEMQLAEDALSDVRDTLVVLDMQAVNLPFNDTLRFLAGCSALKELSLSFNNKGSGHTPFVTASLFKGLGLASLAKLKLYNCNIRSLARDVFQDAENLEDLHLGSNLIGDIPEALGLLHNLKVLDLSSNDIVRLPNASLATLTKLRELKLHRNGLDLIEDNAFLGLHASLASLVLDFCSLRQVPTQALRPLRNLTSLDLTGNLFTDIGPDAFVGAYCLNELYVSSRTLSFDKLMFTGQRFCIKDLKIRRAELTSVPLAPIKDLVKLQYLFLDKNNITRLGRDDLKGITATSISFSDNPIRSIERGAFNGLKAKLILLMERTEVSDLSFIFDYPEDTFRFFSLYESPIPCDCTLHRLLHMRPENFLYGTCSHQGKSINMRDPSLSDILDSQCQPIQTNATPTARPPEAGYQSRGGQGGGLGSGGKSRGRPAPSPYTEEPQVQRQREKQLSLKSQADQAETHQALEVNTNMKSSQHVSDSSKGHHSNTAPPARTLSYSFLCVSLSATAVYFVSWLGKT
jgi:Leucine-rich repeat (LRR) protein